VSNLPIIKRVASRALQAGLDRPKCFYCHKPLRVKDGVCRNCGAPATPMDEPPTPEVAHKVREEIKHRPRKDSPAQFFK
jgi:predicted amidophosphoribosyltransferase